MTGIINKNMQPGAADPDQDQDNDQVPEQDTDQDAGQPPDAATQQGGDDGSNDPNYQQALKFAMDALYKSGAADKIKAQIAGSNDLPNALADAAYNIVSITDEKTQGRVSDEILPLLASSILEEVVDIATAGGAKVQASDVAQALKIMILRYLGENGVDTTQLQSAMDKVNVDDFNKIPDGEEK